MLIIPARYATVQQLGCLETSTGPDKHRKIDACMRSRIVDLATNCYGCHVLQKALDREEEDCLLFVSELLCGNPAKTLVNKHASHVSSRVISTKTVTFLDSGASNHFFRDHSDFRTYVAVAVRTGKSALASEGDFAIVGKGTIAKVFNVGEKEVHITFLNALHAPSLSANLVSVSQFDKAGYYSMFGSRGVIIREGTAGAITLQGHGSDGMYILETANAFANISTAQPTSLKTWHRRLVHGSPHTIEEMRNKNLVSGLDITNHALDGKCLTCQAGRQHTRTYDRYSEPDVPPLDLVAFDLWGPSCAASPGRNIYMMFFVDSGTSHKHTA
ncbi:Gag-Pol polyprotein [Mycena venus]|uniref:Gag-Pol polyprotein n=1 Tax=Mycena venus TaxID=2733690 RepID=A0A8H6Z9H3_9AGAR|nr:Gag-Pol polyprotein [Mycena venus]